MSDPLFLFPQLELLYGGVRVRDILDEQRRLNLDELCRLNFDEYAEGVR